MEAEVRTKKIGGSIGIIIPNQIVQGEKIGINDKVRVDVQKVADLEFLWGRCEDVKISTEEIMREIDEGEDE
jgi:antitoxin component of MazEF toxin-antitoxin module